MAATIALLLIVPGSLILMALAAILSTAAFALVHMANRASRLIAESAHVQMVRRGPRIASTAEVPVVMPGVFAA